MIYAKRPINLSTVNVKIVGNDGKEVSIACDDSCGAFKDLSRSDIRCFQDDLDVTFPIFGEDTVVATIENLQTALDWLKKG